METTAIVALASAGGAVLGALIVQVGAYRLEVRRRDEERRARGIEAQHATISEILDLSSLIHQQLSTMAPEGKLSHSLRPLHGNEQFREVMRRSMRMRALAYATGDGGVIEHTNACFLPIKDYLVLVSKGEFSDESELSVLSPDDERYHELWRVLGGKLAEV
jgi:hypothetical protein